VTERELRGDLSDHFTKMAYATGKVYPAGFAIGHGSAFYLGKFQGRHVMATNHHVTDSFGCGRVQLRLPNSNWTVFGCQEIIGSWPEIDFALFTIGVLPRNEAHFASNAMNLDYDAQIIRSTPLVNIGFGHRHNRRGQQTVAQDEDCVVSSPDQQFKVIEQIYKGSPKVITFAHGCDSSQGDSGSAFMERDTGKVIGINSMVLDPKFGPVTSQAFRQSLENGDENIWHKSNFAVPASAIKNHLLDFLNHHPQFPHTRLLLEILQ
jgi:S1-C subfamily serine protease